MPSSHGRYGQTVLTSWNIHIPEHTIAVRYHVPERSLQAPGDTRDSAILQAVRWAHTDLGVPKWRPYVAETVRVTTATVNYDVRAHKQQEMRLRDERRKRRASHDRAHHDR